MTLISFFDKFAAFGLRLLNLLNERSVVDFDLIFRDSCMYIYYASPFCFILEFNNFTAFITFCFALKLSRIICGCWAIIEKEEFLLCMVCF